MPILPLGLGSRMCELLFIISGFLVGYNKIDKNIPCTFKAGFDYVVSKLVIFFPLHLIVTLLNVLTVYKSFKNFTTWIKLFLSTFFLAAWSPYEDAFFCFNGSSWFLSALLFCYFLSPLFIRLLRTKHPVCLFFTVFFIRFFIDAIPTYTDLEYLALHTHVNPFVRALEFFMGMLMVPQFLKIQSKINASFSQKKKTIIFSILEVIILIGSVLLMYLYLDTAPKSLYVLFFCFFVFIFSFDSGILSKFFSLKVFRKFNNIQFEFYLSHTTFLSYCAFFINILNINISNIYINCTTVIIEFCVLILICIFYKNFIADLFTNIMKKIKNILYDVLNLS